MPKASLQTSKNIQREITAAKILDSFFHNAASAEQRNEFNKFPLNELTEAGGFLATNSFNQNISKRDLNNFEKMDRFKLIFIVAQNWLQILVGNQKNIY